MKKSLFLEERSNGLVDVTEIGDDPESLELMFELGWVRRAIDVSYGSPAADQLTVNPQATFTIGSSGAYSVTATGSVQVTASDHAPTRHDVPDLEVGKVNGHGVAEAEMQAEPIIAKRLKFEDALADEQAERLGGKLLSERVAELLRERKCFTFEAGHHPVTQAVLDVLDSHFGKVF